MSTFQEVGGLKFGNSPTAASIINHGDAGNAYTNRETDKQFLHQEMGSLDYSRPLGT
jgi:hypothetical protein